MGELIVVAVQLTRILEVLRATEERTTPEKRTTEERTPGKEI